VADRFHVAAGRRLGRVLPVDRTRRLFALPPGLEALDHPTAAAVTATLRLALNAAGLNSATVQQRPRLLSDNGPSYLSAQLSTWLDEHGMSHTRGQPYHPMTQGKIERYQRSLKNRSWLEPYYWPRQLEARLATFVDFYNPRRYHQSRANRTPAEIYVGRRPTILARRQSRQHQTIELRRRLHQPAVA
jgi:putative transposase